MSDEAPGWAGQMEGRLQASLGLVRSDVTEQLETRLQDSFGHMEGRLQASLGLLRSDVMEHVESRLQAGIGQLESRLQAGLGQLESRIQASFGVLRSDVMERIDRLQNVVTLIRDDVAVNFGSSSAVKLANDNTREELRALGDVVSAMHRQIQRLQTDVRELRGEP